MDLVFLLSLTSLPGFSVSSDAAGALGCRAISGHGWFVGEWSSSQHPPSMACRGLFPVVIAASLWGHRWATKRVEFRLHNMAVVSVLSSGTSKDPNMMRFHCLAPPAAHVATPIPPSLLVQLLVTGLKSANCI